VYKNFPALTISAQNCNSLNISTNCPKQATKLSAILDYKSDLIFVSDIRLNNNLENIRDIESCLLSATRTQYKFIYNSSKNKRGVGILINSNLDFNLINDHQDVDENILGLFCTVAGVNLLLISIYGPNVDNPDFFGNLESLIDLYLWQYCQLSGMGMENAK